MKLATCMSEVVSTISNCYLNTALNKAFCGFLMGSNRPSNQYWAGRVYDLYFYFMTGTPEGSTESGFMEKPGIEPATTGLREIGLSPTPRRLLKTFFVAFLGINQFCGLV